MTPTSSNAVPYSQSTESSQTPPRNPIPPPPAGGHSPTPLWLLRADIFLSVMVHLYLGLALLFLPWMRFWALNRFFLYYAPVAHIMQSGAFRGMISGLGLLNFWIALSDAIHYKES